MPRRRPPGPRLSLKRAFTAILAFVTLTLILTLVFFVGRYSGSEVRLLKDHLTDSPWDPSRGVGIPASWSVSMKLGEGRSYLKRGGSGRTDKEERHGNTDSGVVPIEGNNHEMRWVKEGGEKSSGRGVEDKVGRVQAHQVLDLLRVEPKEADGTQMSRVSRKLLMTQIELLRDAMISNSSMLSQPSVMPSCVGNRKKGEVEDLLCIPKPEYLKNVKNPCWYDTESSKSQEPAALRIRCLPYFYILGCAKSGTTDLWMRLTSHPHMVANRGAFHKEALWWSWHRYGVSGYKRMMMVSFRSYLNLFSDLSRRIQESLVNGDALTSQLITGDASPPDFWDFRGWRNISQNRGLDRPSVVTPHLMRHFHEDPKFILMFRDPIDRLYSDYFFVGGGLTSQDFHQDVIQSISMLADCVKSEGLQGCFYDHKFYLKLPVRLPFACYSVFMREWLQVFPLDKFFFIKTEEYEAKPEETLKAVINFLGLHPLRETKIQAMAKEERARVTLQKRVAGPMKASTKALLTSLLQPCSHILARLIKQPQFVWDT